MKASISVTMALTRSEGFMRFRRVAAAENWERDTFGAKSDSTL